MLLLLCCCTRFFLFTSLTKLKSWRNVVTTGLWSSCQRSISKKVYNTTTQCSYKQQVEGDIIYFRFYCWVRIQVTIKSPVVSIQSMFSDSRRVIHPRKTASNPSDRFPADCSCRCISLIIAPSSLVWMYSHELVMIGMMASSPNMLYTLAALSSRQY